ncbi:tetratricopeptide repeat protein [Bradyrhizobium sp. HKCCYLS1011]|uniref:tetratricopeptide repeat protein n=1 Tax=Bradyrhizobium sp. HKCCYLS1011 TaxID=3420733 RepID=UPI003EC09DD7
MLFHSPLRIDRNDTVSWKYLSGAIAVVIFGVAMVAQLVWIPVTSIVEGEHATSIGTSRADEDTGQARIEVAAVPPAPITASEPHDQQETDANALQGEIEQAIAAFDRAIERNPRDATAFRKRAKAWESKGDTDRALADYDAAIRVAPDDPTAFRDRGELWRRLGALDRALADFDRAIRFTFADAGIYCDRGLVWNKKGEHDRAIADFSHALKLDPRRACAYMGRGLALLGKGELADARANINEAILIDPSLRSIVGRSLLELKLSLEEDLNGKQ